MLKLNLGCGPKKLEGYINVDSNENHSPDLVFDLSKTWTWKPDSVDEILLDNVVEHLDDGIVSIVIKSKLVLKPNGKLIIVCPNCFHWKARLRYLLGEFGANSGFHYDHRWLYKPSFIKAVLEYEGFEVNKVNDLFDQEVKIIARKRL